MPPIDPTQDPTTPVDQTQQTQQPVAPPVQPGQPDPRSNVVTKAPVPADTGKQIKFLTQITDHMLSGSKKSLMIGGDTGLGKTSFVRQFGKLIGLPVVIIEVPHVTEEELINIPFIVIEPTGEVHKGVDTVDREGAPHTRTQFGLKLSKSHLVSTLEKLHKEAMPSPDTLDPHSGELLSAFLKNAVHRQEFGQIRNQYDRILFLDEFFRQTNPTIVNILRNILNGLIGNDRIPKGTYTMYASNLTDTGGALAKQTEHTTFDQLEFPAPTVNNWLNFMVSGSHKSNIQFKKDVIDAFSKALTDQDLDFRDMVSNVRSSPRRWSEVLMYINANYPFANADEASIMKSVMQRQFKNDEGEMSPAYNVLDEIITALTLKSGIDLKKVKPIPPTAWRDILAQNILTKLTVGESKKYVPVVQGPPGIGKTAIAGTFERPPYNLRFIPILASTLSADSISGIPLADTSKGEIETSFAKPELANLIDKKVEEARRLYMEELQSEDPATAKQRFNEWESQTYKYLIFFDEINRVKNVGVFNALRRVILEKSFNDKDKLPEGSLVIAAMNPKDIGGTTIGMTEHFKDAIEIIDAETSWKDFIAHVEKFVVPDIKRMQYHPDDISVKTGYEIISKFPDVFTTKEKGKKDSYQFHINVGEGDSIYLSPRDYDNMLRQVVKGIDRSFKGLAAEINQGANIPEQQVNAELVDAAYDKIEPVLKNKFHQADIGNPPGFMERVRLFLHDNINVSLKKQTASAGLSGLIDQAIQGGEPLAENPDFFNYISDLSNPAAIRADMEKYLHNITNDFLDNEHINIDAAEPFLFDKGPGSIYNVFEEFANAIKGNFDTGFLDNIEDAIYDVYLEANKAIASEMGETPEAEDLIIRMLEVVDAIHELK